MKKGATLGASSMTAKAPVRRRRDLPATDGVAAWRRLGNRAAWIAASVVCVIAIAVTLILGAVRFAFSWQPVYTYAVTAYHADEVTNISSSGLLAATHQIRNYFTNGERDLDIRVTDKDGNSGPLFNEREIAHMRDVKALVRRIYILLDGAALYTLAFAVVALALGLPGRRRLARVVLAGSLAATAVIVGLGAAALIGFDQLFTEFHVLSFSNDFWELNPAQDHLVQIFPQGFWFDITIFAGALALLAALCLAVLSGTYLVLTRTGLGKPLVPAACAGAATGTSTAARE
jgi:integral membrane protein (TIGR01906 family)